MGFLPDFASTGVFGNALPNPLELATGLLAQTSGLGYLIAAFFLLVVGTLVIFKFFDTLTKVVIVAGISAFLPVAINMATAFFFGTGILQITPQVIMQYVAFGISVFFLYRTVTLGVDVAEKAFKIVTMPFRSAFRFQQARAEKKEKKEFHQGIKEIKKMKENK